MPDRTDQYGEFEEQALVDDAMRKAMYESRNWEDMEPYMRSAMLLCVHKFSRILNGNWLNHDSWVDAMDYIKLVVDRLPATAVELSQQPAQVSPETHTSGPVDPVSLGPKGQQRHWSH